MKFLKQLSSSISLKKDEFYNVALCYTFLNEAPAVHTSKFTSHIPFCESVIMEAPTWSGIMWTTKTTKKIQRKMEPGNNLFVQFFVAIQNWKTEGNVLQNRQKLISFRG